MPVVDQTGLAGQYDFTLEYGLDPGAADAAEQGGGLPPLQVAIQQLGLRSEGYPGARSGQIVLST